MTDHADGNLLLAGDGGPRMAGAVHREVLSDAGLRGNRLQQAVDAVLHHAVLVALALAGSMDDRQQIGSSRRMAVHDLLHRMLPSHHQHLARLPSGIGHHAVVHIVLLQIGEVDERHPSRVEAEQEQVAGEALVAVAQPQPLDAPHLLQAQGTLRRSLRAREHMGERLAVLAHALLHSPVIDGPDDAHVERDAVHRQPLTAKERLQALHQFARDLRHGDVATLPESTQLVVRSLIRLARPGIALRPETLDLLPEERQEHRPALPLPWRSGRHDLRLSLAKPAQMPHADTDTDSLTSPQRLYLLRRELNNDIVHTRVHY